MSRPTRRSVLGLLAAAPAVALTARAASAREPDVFAVDGVAINGADPVAYFTEGGPSPAAARTR